VSQAPTLRAVVLAVLVALVGACTSVEPAGTGAVDTSTTTTTAGANETVATVPDTSVTVPEPTVDDVLSEQLAMISVPEGMGAAMVALVDEDGSVNYASKGSDWGGARLTPDAAFRIGSITKTFTAVVVLMLVDEGVIDLDEEAAEYVARVVVPEGVTVRDLLQHTSGIPNYTAGPDNPVLTSQDNPERVWSPEELIALVEDRRVLKEPGTAFSYSNTNYAILGILVEEVTGMPFATVLRNRILDRLELDATYPAANEVGAEPFDAYTTSPTRRSPLAPGHQATWSAPSTTSIPSSVRSSTND
jgi:D-alanyl-D-alanine carboxypeptidase